MKMLTDKEVLTEMLDIYEFEKNYLLEQMDYAYEDEERYDSMKIDLNRVEDYIDLLKRLLFQHSKVSGEGKGLS